MIALDAAEERVLDAPLPPPSAVNFDDLKPTDNATRQKFRKMLREGQFDDKEIDIEIAVAAPQMEVMAPPAWKKSRSRFRACSPTCSRVGARCARCASMKP